MNKQPPTGKNIVEELITMLTPDVNYLRKAFEEEVAAGGLGAETARIFLTCKCVDCGAERPIWTFRCAECKQRSVNNLIESAERSGTYHNFV